MSNTRRRAATFLLLLLMSLPGIAHAQSIGGDVSRSRPVSVRESVEQQLTESLWRLGPLRLQPTVTSSVGYHGNLYADEEGNEQHDFGGTLGAGVTFILPMGEKLFARGTVLPQYTYFTDSEISRSSGTYSGELLALFNQMLLQAGASTMESFSSVSSEIEAPALVSGDRRWAIASVEIVPRFSLYGAGEIQELDHSDEEFVDVGELERLDRESTILRGGFRYDFRSYLTISPTYETTETRFSVRPTARDFDSSAILLGIEYDVARFFLNLSAGQREIEPALPGTFEPYDTVTGSFAAGYSLGAPIVVSFYGNRTVKASAFEDNSIYLNQELGVDLSGQVGQRIRLSVFGGGGENSYPLHQPSGGNPQRLDDIEILGGGIGWRLFRNIWLNVDARETSYDSNIDGFDRTVFRVTTSISTTFSFSP